MGCRPLGLRRLQDLAQRRERPLGPRMAGGGIRQHLSGGLGEDAGALRPQMVRLVQPCRSTRLGFDKGDHAMSQSHFTLSFPLKSPADAKALAQELPPLMPDLFRAEDAIGTLHYSRFTVLSDRTLLFLADFDGDFGPLMRDLARRAGPVFDLIFKHVSDPPPMPVASNADAFTEWAAGHLLSPAYVFSAYPGPTVKEIKAMASAAGVEGRTQLLPFLVILPARGRLAFAEMQLILRTMAMTGKVDRDMTSVGTPHFAQFVPLEDQQLGFFTVYDGAFDKY